MKFIFFIGEQKKVTDTNISGLSHSMFESFWLNYTPADQDIERVKYDLNKFGLDMTLISICFDGELTFFLQVHAKAKDIAKQFNKFREVISNNKKFWQSIDPKAIPFVATKIVEMGGRKFASSTLTYDVDQKSFDNIAKLFLNEEILLRNIDVLFVHNNHNYPYKLVQIRGKSSCYNENYKGFPLDPYMKNIDDNSVNVNNIRLDIGDANDGKKYEDIVSFRRDIREVIIHYIGFQEQFIAQQIQDINETFERLYLEGKEGQ